MADTGAKTRLKRTRTGCFKCRMRRRKCDEGKPSCRRCLDGGFECQYGTRLSFLEKNAKTAGASDRVSKPAYGKLRFVVPESVTVQEGIQLQDEDDVNSSRGSESTGAPSKIEQQPLPAPPQPQPQPAQSPTELLSEPPSLLNPVLDNIATPSPDGRVSGELRGPDSYTVGISPSNAAYESALDGLLSLGNDHYAPPPPVSSHMPETESYFGSPPNPQSEFSPGQLEKVSRSFAGAFQNCAHLPQDRAVQLLRHYRYNIAPWLDIGDAAQTFGLLVPRIAMESAPVLDSLLALAMTTLDEFIDAEFGEPNSAPPDPNGPGVDVLYGALVFGFAALRRHVLVAPTSWQSPSKHATFGLLNSAMLQEQYPAIDLPLSWIMLRLELSVGLLNGSPVSIPTILQNTASPISLICRESFKYDREPILLCAQVLNHCFGQDIPTTPGLQPRPTPAQNWKSLTESLNMWYTNRPRDFKPMWEMEESEELFPLVLFTNGAAILANQLYHTSMLLLLQNRPRTLPKEHGRSVLVSPLWHAQRICAISLNNDTSTNWDFSLLASFYLAARRMTYEPQQQVILRNIDRIGSLTGWNVSALSAQLVQEWRPD